MLFISLIGLGFGVFALVVLGVGMFVSVAFGSEPDDQFATSVDDADFEVSDSCVLQVMRDARGCPVVAPTRQMSPRPFGSTRT